MQVAHEFSAGFHFFFRELCGEISDTRRDDALQKEAERKKLCVSLIKMNLAQKARHAKEIFVGHKLIIIYAMFNMHVCCAAYITFKGKNDPM